MSGVHVVSVYVSTDDPAAVARAAEVLARAIAGLALDGVTASLRVGPDEEQEGS